MIFQYCFCIYKLVEIIFINLISLNIVAEMIFKYCLWI